MSGEKIIVSYGDYLIRQSDLNLLKYNQWLNDILIGFYLEYLGKTSSADPSSSSQDVLPKLSIFIGPEVTQLLKLIPGDQVSSVLGDLATELPAAQYIFLPINDSVDPNRHNGGSHWSLLVFSRPDNTFIHFDSSSSNCNEEDAQIICTKLSPLVSESAGASQSSNSVGIGFKNHPECTSQSNSYDCGVHVISNTQLISDYVKSHPNVLLLDKGCPTATPKQAKDMRKTMLELIQKLTQ